MGNNTQRLATTAFVLAQIAANPPGATAWGAITGTLSAQTDLQAALNAKLADAPNDGKFYVRKSGAWVAIVPGATWDNAG